MAELLKFVPNQLQRAAQNGRRVVGFVADPLSSRLGHTGAKRNALRATLQAGIRHTEENILDCSQPWRTEVLQNPHPDVPVSPLESAAIERRVLGKLVTVHKRLTTAFEAGEPIAVEPLLQQRAELAEQIPDIDHLVPAPRTEA